MTKKESKGVRMQGDEETETKEESHGYVYWQERRRLRLEREKKEAEEKRQKNEATEVRVDQLIEESGRLNLSRVEKLTKINEILIDLQLAEEWFKEFRSFLETVCGSPATQSVIIVLERVKDDRWVMRAEVSP